MRATQFDPEAISQRFSPDDLAGQFLLSQSRPGLSWPCESLGGWHLAVEPRLPRVKLTQGGAHVGWLLGNPIAPEGRIVTQDFELPPGDVEDAIYALGGRFLAILPVIGRVYLDPCGFLSAVYCEHAGIVAATSSLIPFDELTPSRTALIQAMGLPHMRCRFPAAMTARENVERILPNHYLDLKTWRCVRHWPTGELPPLADVAATAAEITEIAKRDLSAIYAHGPASLTLTAGEDTRMLLACSKPFAAELDCVTFDNNDQSSWTDIRVAKRVARRAQVGRHRVVEWKDPTERDLALWLYRTGYCVGEPRGWDLATAVWASVDPAQAMIFGTVSELSRPKYRHEGDTPETKISAERLIDHAACIATPETVARTRAWIDAVPIENSLRLLDLYYMEANFGAWAGVWSYDCFSYHSTFPLNHRRAVELFLRLPEATRRSQSFKRGIIQQEWPELMREPINPRTFKQRAKDFLRPAFRRLKRRIGV